jgi:hypothetical protein
MRYLKASALAFIIAAPGLAFASTAQAASECPVAGILSTWGINSVRRIQRRFRRSLSVPPQDRRRNSEFEHFA